MSLQELRSVMGHSENMDTLGVYAHGLDDATKRIKEKQERATISLLG